MWRSTSLLLAALAASTAGAAERYDPSLRFRTITTPHFFVHFHQGESDLARRLARVAEEAHDALVARFGPAATRARTHVVLVDQDDVANGWAMAFPFNVVQIIAAAPATDELTGNTDDWLRIVFTHEYTHILHLDRAGGLIAGLRRVFGRAPALFPNQFLPVWQIEGIATYAESAITGRGRVPSADFRRIVRAAAREGAFEPLDRVNGGLVDWPAGHAPYAYGAYFHEHLARRFGEATLRALADATARRLPYLPFGSYRRAFGDDLGALWRAFRDDAERSAPGEALRPPAPPDVRRLTRDGFVAGAPRWSADGRRLLYSLRTPHRFPALMSVAPGEAPTRVATRVGGWRTTTAGDVVMFDQLEYVRSVGIQSDLYQLHLPTGRVRRLTRGARASDPDLAPDGRRVACVVHHAGRRGLAILDLQDAAPAPRIIASEPETQFGAPRWSPDGRAIAVERRRLRGASEIVTVDPESRDTRILVSSARARNATPEWSRDGRWLLFASDRDGGPLNLYAVDVGSGSLLRLPGRGASSPAVSPDGRQIAFVGYTPDGFDLFTMPFDAAGWTPAPPADAGAAPPQDAAATSAPGERSYRPWSTVWPRFWMPVIERDNEALEAGLSTGGADALGWHAFGAAITWGSGGARPDWQAAYAYDRWRPTLFVAGSDDLSEWQGADYRDRTFDAGGIMRFRRMRRVQTLTAALRVSQEIRDCAAGAGCDEPGRSSVGRRALRGGWSFSTAKEYGYSISAQDGVRVSIVVEATRAALGSTGDATAAILQARAFPSWGARHTVLAIRAAAAAVWGDDRVVRRFGAGGPAAAPPGGIGRDAVGLLRGYAADAVVGRRAAVANVDYRWPLMYVQRGLGTWPFFIRALHAAAFVDAGHAWDRRVRAGDITLTTGAELSMDTVVGYHAPLTLAAGVAWRRPGRDGLPDGAAVFARIGRAF